MIGLVLCVSACAGRSREPEMVLDLTAHFSEARKQPADTSFDIRDVTINGITKRSIIAREQTRITFHATVPKHAVLRTSVALDPAIWQQPGDGVLLFIGVADAHSFQTKRSLVVHPSDRQWRDISVNLDEFAGLTIDIVLNTRAGPGEASTVQNDIAVWGAPVIWAR